MKCDQFERRMHQMLDRRLPPEADASIRAHAAACPSCHAMLDLQELLLDQLAVQRPTLDVGAGPPRKQSPKPVEVLPRGTSWRAAPSVLTVGASILCLLAASHFLRRHVATEPEFVRLSPATDVIFAHVAENNYYPPSSEVAPSTPAAISHTLVGIQLVSHTDWSSWAPFSTAVAPRLGPGLSADWIEQVAGSVQPLADSVTSAIHILKRALPSGHADTASGHNDPQAALDLPSSPQFGRDNGCAAPLWA